MNNNYDNNSDSIELNKTKIYSKADSDVDNGSVDIGVKDKDEIDERHDEQQNLWDNHENNK